MGNPVPFYGVSLFYRVVLLLALLAAVLTIGALVYTVLAWKDKYWGIAGRVYYTLVTLAAVAFVWFLHYVEPAGLAVLGPEQRSRFCIRWRGNKIWPACQTSPLFLMQSPLKDFIEIGFGLSVQRLP